MTPPILLPHLLRAAVLWFVALIPAATLAQQIDSNYEIEVFSGTGLEDGQAALAIYVKPAPDVRSQRITYTEIFGRRGNPENRVTLEIDGLPIPTDALAVAISGQLNMQDGRTLYLPVKVYAFADNQRRDKLPAGDVYHVSKVPNTAFSTSFPFDTYRCKSTMDGRDLTRVVLASRVMLTERNIYLAQDASWKCLELFFEKNAQVLRGVPSEKLNEVMAFLSDYRIFQGDEVPERFITLYVKFLREIVKIDKMGTKLSDQQTLEDQMRSELTEIMTRHPMLSIPFGGSLFDALDKHGAADLCLENAETLFFALATKPRAHFEELRLVVDKPEGVLDFAMKEAMGCAITEAHQNDVDLQTYGPIAGAAGWLGRTRPDFIQAYLGLFDHLQAINWITADRAVNDRSLDFVKDYYLALFEVFPRPRSRPGS